MKKLLSILTCLILLSSCVLTQDTAKRKIVIHSMEIGMDGSATIKGIGYIDAASLEQANQIADSAKKIIIIEAPKPVPDSINLYYSRFIIHTPKFIKP